MNKRRVHCEDIIKLERPKMPCISPKGNKVAYVVEQSNLETNSVQHTFYIFDKDKDTTISLFTCDKIRNITWIDDFCYLIRQDETTYQLLRILDNTIEILLTDALQLSSYAISFDEQQIFYSRLVKTAESVIKKSREEGYVYRWNQDGANTIIHNDFQHYEYEEIWCVDYRTQEKNLMIKFPWGNWPEWTPEVKPLIETMSLSPDGNFLAICLNRLGKPALGEAGFQFDLTVLDVKKNKSFQLLKDHIAAKATPCWVSDYELVFQEANYNQAEKKFDLWLWNANSDTYNKLVFFELNKMIKSVVWNKQAQLLYAESNGAIHQVSLTKQEVKIIPIPSRFFNQQWIEKSVSWDQAFNCLSAIIEDRENLPQVVLYEVHQDKTINLTSLNKSIDNLLLGQLEPVIVEAKTGNNELIKSKGFLLHPLNEVQGKRYPLIVAAYGFSGNRHPINAEEWHTSFPAQVFSGESYFVLLLNHPQSNAQSNIVDNKRARDEEGWHMLRIFEQAVTDLEQRGCIDSDKVGIYGWSHGAFIVEFLIAHSDKFKVAALGEGGDYNPGSVWCSGNQHYVNMCNNLFGGPPWSKSCLGNYLEFSPFFQVERIKAPTLMEFCGGDFSALEMYVPLRYQHIPAELVLYYGEDHNFVKPKARLASMIRKLDWFNYWFYNKRDNSKPDQYVRWDEMKIKYVERDRTQK